PIGSPALYIWFSPTIIPTCVISFAVPYVEWKKTRSPGSASDKEIDSVASYCSCAVRGRLIPASRYTHRVDPLQSNAVLGLARPNTYAKLAYFNASSL